MALMSCFGVILTSVSLLIVWLTHWYISRVRHMSKLVRNGIPGPKPSLIFGNMIQLKAIPTIQRHEQLVKKYGKIVGYYSGHRPTILVADPELAKNIQIKDFQYFSNRPQLPLKNGIHPNPAFGSSLTKTGGKRWKEMRSVLTPTFSGSKLRTMTPIIDDAINNFINIIDKNAKSGQEFDIYDMFQNLTTDVIARTAFGIQTNVQNESNNRFLGAAKAIFNIKISKWVVLLICFPMIDTIFYPFRRLKEIIDHRRGLSPNGILYDMAKDVIQLREQNPNNRRKDLLQLMLDTNMAGEEMSAMTDQQLTASNDKEVVKDHENGNNRSNVLIRLTDDEIVSNCVLFYEAGYETTSTALGYMAHILVNYPEVQEKCRSEVNELYESEGKLDFNTVSRLQYMEWVLNETMRIYPPVISFTSREALIDYKYKDITIPKTTNIVIATHYLQNDPDYWPEPEKFDPERFSPQRKHEINPSSWQPFGSGPRNCIGLRFALFEAKLALAKLLLNYRLEPTPKTEIGILETECKLLTRTPKNGIYVKAIKI